jgi:hypothetical protein
LESAFCSRDFLAYLGGERSTGREEQMAFETEKYEVNQRREETVCMALYWV